MQTTSAAKENAFAEDVRKGLSAKPKSLSSQYFYDDEGSRLFREIMKLPEYYLTRAEDEIFRAQTPEITAAFAGETGEFDLIELGAGDGAKTAVLIDYFTRRKIDFTYAPIDISRAAVEGLTAKFAARFPDLRMNAQIGDYFRILGALKTETKRRRILLFLGSNIGNFSAEQSVRFFQSLRAAMNADDLLFVGFDLQKDPRVILEAYDDAQGVTAQFNLNLLRRINRELGANFRLENFSHYAVYHPVEGAARSFLISRERQTVTIEALGESFEFAAWEAIFMEISQKYNAPMIADLAAASGFAVERNFFDAREFFVDSLWRTADEQRAEL